MSSSPVIIRPVLEADLPTVHALFLEHLAALGGSENPELDKDMHDIRQAYSGPGNTFVVAAHSPGEIKAMAGVKDGEIRRLFVRPEFRGKGTAVELINYLIDFHQGHGAGRLTAVVARNNHAARAAFRRCGFVFSGRVPDHPQMRHCDVWEREPRAAQARTPAGPDHVNR